MADETIIEELDSTTETEEETDKTPDDSDKKEEKPEPTESEKRLYARLKQKEEKLKKAEEELVKLKSKADPANPQQFATKEDLERIELRSTYSAEIVDAIMDAGGRKSLDNPVIKAGIDSMVKKEKSKQATPNVGSNSPVYKNHTQEELKNMTVEQLEKILPHAPNA